MRSALVALFLLSACAQTPAEPPAAETVAAIHLSGTKWRRADDMNANPHGATLEFGDAQASGHTGCRPWFGAVTQDGEALRFREVEVIVATSSGATACEPEVSAATEQSFLDVLAATRYGHYDQDALVLLDEDQHVIARFDNMEP